MLTLRRNRRKHGFVEENNLEQTAEQQDLEELFHLEADATFPQDEVKNELFGESRL